MPDRCFLTYEGLTAWSTLAAAIGTIGAVIVALWQAAKARKEATREQKYRNWLEQKRLEEKYLTQTLEAVGAPLEVATDFFFSGSRLLAGIPTTIAPTPEQEQAVLQFVEQFAKETREPERVLGGYINIVGALRELHRARGEADVAKQYEDLLKDVDEAFNAASDLREQLADVDTIRSLPVGGFVELPMVAKARDAAHRAERTIARHVVRLYDNPPSA